MFELCLDSWAEFFTVSFGGNKDKSTLVHSLKGCVFDEQENFSVLSTKPQAICQKSTGYSFLIHLYKTGTSSTFRV